MEMLFDEDLKREFSSDWDLEYFDNHEGSVKQESDDMPELHHLEVLSRCFGHKKFRPMQWKIINSIFKKEDNCAIMTTGYGKSLCYQFPAVYADGLALVVSPLISLMEDQVLAMKVSNIPACLLGTANKEKEKTIDEIFECKYRLVYVTPEFCTGDYGKGLLMRMYNELNILLIAVDEAHCVSSWGHEFRFQYRQLGILKTIMPDVPILAVTATATQKVRSDIIECLKLRNPQVTCSGFDRPNLYFSVYLKSANIMGDLRKVMTRIGGEWKFPGSTIVYCITRKQTEEISDLLNASGCNSLPYHAGLSLKLRKQTHELFVKDKIDIIVATIAFGMGIDKPDVRYIIHYGASNSIEGYYQEVGRAGRDGLPSSCTLFYSNKDFDTLRFLNERSTSSTVGKANKERMINDMKNYISSTKCRRDFILGYFEDKKATTITSCCDNCSISRSGNTVYDGLNSEGKYDFAKDAEIFLKAVEALNGKFGINMYILFLRGSKMNRITSYVNNPLHGSGKDKSDAWWKGIAVLLENQNYLKKVQNAYSKSSFCATTVCVSDKGKKFLKATDKSLLLPPVPELLQCLKIRSNVWLSTTHQLQPSTSFSFNKEDTTDELVKRVYQLLLNKRTELARSHDCMPYSIASNTALMEMAKRKPTTLDQLKNCQLEGFTEVKIAKFGEEFIKMITFSLNSSSDESVQKMSIEEALSQYPLSGAKNNSSAHTSYSFFKSGLTVEEIAQKRGYVSTIIISHLIEVLKLGYPIKLSDLGVTKEIKNTIEDAIKKVDTGLSILTPIKNACPPDITFNQVKAVVAYIQIRDHLKSLNIPYVDFEDMNSLPSTSSTDAEHKLPSEPSPTQNLRYLIQKFEEIEQSSSNSQKSNSECNNEWDDSNFSDGINDCVLSAACDELETSLEELEEKPVTANSITYEKSEATNTQTSSGFNFSLLDSPPRNILPEKRKLDESQPKPSTVNKKLKLPPWLTSKRIS